MNDESTFDCEDGIDFKMSPTLDPVTSMVGIFVWEEVVVMDVFDFFDFWVVIVGAISAGRSNAATGVLGDVSTFCCDCCC